MNIEIVRHAGFCFGVEHAVKTVEQLISEHNGDGTSIYTLGQLIHNPQYVKSLRARGVRDIGEEDIDSVCSAADAAHPVVIVIRAHGVEKKISERLAYIAQDNPHVSVVDCTCHDVRKIHSIVAEQTAIPGTLAVIIGDRAHPEVRGICSYAAGDFVVCANVDELKMCNLSYDRVVVVSQTTQNINEFKKCQEFLQKVCTNAIIFDTICRVTEIRQTETANLARRSDFFFVIGGRHSSNTRHLFETALSVRGGDTVSHDGNPSDTHGTFLIEDASELASTEVVFRHNAVIGITAGASTPGGIIEEVVSTMNQNEQEFQNEDFAGMLEESLKTLHTGETVKGIITSVTPNELYVDLGAKMTGVIPVDELGENIDGKIEDLYHVGDEIEAIVGKVSDAEGIAALSRRKIEGIAAWKKIVEACEQQTILEGKVVEAVKGGVIMLVENFRVFVPASHTGLSKEADLAPLVGTTHRVKILEVNEQRRRAVASIRVVLRDERRARENAFWDTIEVGRQYTGMVKSLTSYGAFVDLGGVDGMVHSSELSWKHIKSPAEVVSVGDEITVFVKSFDRDAHRISLGYKTEATNPWLIFKSNFAVGDVTSVKIVSLLPFGAFAEVVPGTDGLIHISQIADHKIAKPSDVLSVGQIVDAKITQIDDEKQKISLSIRALLEDIEEAAEAAAEDELSSSSADADAPAEENN